MTKEDMEARAMDLKKELQRLVKVIVEADDDGYAIETLEEVMKTLSALMKLKSKKSSSDLEVPEEFKCPISKELMIDPVIVSTGQTYDRPFIQSWLKEHGQRTCPKTKQVLSYSLLTPNYLVREIISRWCKDHGIDHLIPTTSSADEPDDTALTKFDRTNLKFLIGQLCSSSLSLQKEAAKGLRRLTTRVPSIRTLFSESPDFIRELTFPLSTLGSFSVGPINPIPPPDLHEDLITTLLNISIHDDNKRLVAENPFNICVLIGSLVHGTIQTKINAAAALFTLAALDSNKVIIGKSGALKYLIDLLKEGHPLVVKDVALAIYNICILVENRSMAVDAGAVRVIMEKIKDKLLVDELLTLLAMLSSHQNAVEEMADLGAVPCFLRIISETMNTDRNTENCMAMIYSICARDRKKLREISKEKDGIYTVSKLTKYGNTRAIRKAEAIMHRLLEAGMSAPCNE